MKMDWCAICNVSLHRLYTYDSRVLFVAGRQNQGVTLSVFKHF